MVNLSENALYLSCVLNFATSPGVLLVTFIFVIQGAPVLGDFHTEDFIKSLEPSLMSTAVKGDWCGLYRYDSDMLLQV